MEKPPIERRMCSMLSELLRMIKDDTRKTYEDAVRIPRKNPGLLSEEENTQAVEAKEQTLRLLYDALKKKKRLLVEDPKEFGEQMKMFNDSPIVTEHLVKELIRELRKVTFAKSAKPEKHINTYAYVYTGSRDRTIYLCELFWKEDPESRSRQDTIIHEVSHFLGYGHTVQENSDRVKKSPQSMLCPLTADSVASALTSDMDHPGIYIFDSFSCCGETSRDTVCEESKMGKKLRFLRKVDHLWRNIFLWRNKSLVKKYASGEERNSPEETDSPGHTVWILGDSFIHWAERRAAENIYGRNLSLPPDQVQIHWMGVRGQRWEGLIDHIQLMRKHSPDPDVIIIHLGGNDIGKIGAIDLVFEMKQSLRHIHGLFPDVTLIFSEIVPRLLWLESLDLTFCEKIRKRINRTIFRFMPSLGGVSFRHKSLEAGIAERYRGDKVHLSEIGLDIFNVNLQSMIEMALPGVESEWP